MVMRLQMNENQVCQSQVHVTARRHLISKPGKRGLNSRLRPVLWGGGIVLTLPNRDWKRTVNMTLAKGDHTKTWRTARNFLMFHMVVVRLNNKRYIIIFDWGNSQVRFLAIQIPF
jgi:hypothetical protein